MAQRTTRPTVELPEGFAYQSEFLREDEQSTLLAAMEALEFHPFDFHGYTARRRVVEYGYEYDFGARKTSAAPPIPEFLIPLRDKAAAFAGALPEEIIEAVVIEYPPGAPIGWHRDVPQFEIIIGISLGSSCRMRLKPYKAEGKIASVILEPGSIYVMRGPARWKYQHSIAAVEKLRYSVTFRTLRAKKSASETAEKVGL